MLDVIVGFHLFGPPRENGGCSSRVVPFLSPLATYFLNSFINFFMETMENHQQCVFLSNLFAPWQETFADAVDGDGGDHLEPFGIILD